MTNAVKSQLIPLSIPYGGMSTRYPISAMPPAFSPWIRDMDNEGGVFESRRGVKWRFNASTNYISAIGPHPTDKNKVIFIDTFGSGTDIEYSTYDAITGTAVDVGAVLSTSAQPRALSVSFNKKLFFFMNGSQPLIHDGTTMANTTITGPTLASVVAGFVYRSRLYVFQKSSTTLWYSGIPGGIGGAFGSFDFGPLTSDMGIIMCAFSFTLSSGLNSQVLMGIVFDTGEVIFYAGAYPASADWQIVGRARIGAPLGYQSTIEVNGDILVLTKTGIVSMRELLTTAQGDVQAASITYEIEKYWTQLINDILANETLSSWTPEASLVSYINGAFHQQRNKIVIFLPKILTPHSSSTKLTGYVYEASCGALVYDIATKSWVVHVLNIVESTNQLISNYYWPTFGKLLFGTNATGGKGAESCWEYWGENTFRDKYESDAFNPVYPQLYTTFTELTYQSKINMIYVTQEGAFSKGQANVAVLADSGASFVQGASTQQTNALVSRDKFNAGVTGTNFQVKLGTSTAGDGSMTSPYKIIGIQALIEQQRGVI